MVSVVGHNLHSAVRKLNCNKNECNAMCSCVIVIIVGCLPGPRHNIHDMSCCVTSVLSLDNSVLILSLSLGEVSEE